MYDIIAFIGIICAIIALTIAFVMRMLKKRTLANIFEMVAIFFLLIYSAKFTYLFGSIISLDLDEWAGIIFFLFTVALAVYKVVYFVRYH
ncbi:MAG TPA: hypothetical protein PKO28_03295 [Bacilli bacterium]|nr:hypothetical protein [Bacilli bacterium]HPS18619.1 hypothetical protein [Bacilli bacterium]